MTPAWYQHKVKEFKVYPPEGALNYVALGLAGEVGEVANQVKKIIRDDSGVLTPERIRKLHDEIGDVLWYVAALCNELHFEMSDVMSANVYKLTHRQTLGTIQGDKRDEY